MSEHYANKSDIALMAKDIDYIKDSIRRQEDMIRAINEKLENNYVSQIEFVPIRNVVYGMVGIVLVEVLGIILYVSFGR